MRYKLLTLIGAIAIIVGCLSLPALATTQPVYDVTKYGAKAGDKSDDTAAFSKAMKAAAANNGITYVPQGSGKYLIFGLDIPSNTDLQVAAGTVIGKYGTNNGPLIKMQGPTNTTFGHNMTIEGVGGKFTFDLRNAGPDTGPIQVTNVDGFTIRNLVSIMYNDGTGTGGGWTHRPTIIFTNSNDTQNADGTYNAPRNGLIENIDDKNAAYGWGTVQLTGGQHLTFNNLTSDGGIALRMENYTSNWTPIDDISANGITCTNGHAAMSASAHDSTDGVFHVQNVTANSCEDAVVLADQSGYFSSNSTIDTINVNPGNTAQLRDPNGVLGDWVIGKSKYSIENKQSNFTVQITNLNSGGLPWYK